MKDAPLHPALESQQGGSSHLESTYISVDLGHPGEQIQQGGDGANGEANDFLLGERLQGKT